MDVGIWIDPKAWLLIIDAASQASPDDAVTLPVKSSLGLAVALLNTKVSSNSAMSEWLISLEAPSGFSVDRDCELKAADESKAVARYVRHPLDNDEVRKPVRSGKLLTRPHLEKSRLVCTD